MDDKTDSYDVTAEADQAHDDQWLADQVVTLHVAWRSEAGFYCLVGQSGNSNIAKYFVRDWRVAGALMEKCLEASEITIYDLAGGDGIGCTVAKSAWKYRASQGDSAPRAIIEACVRAKQK